MGLESKTLPRRTIRWFGSAREGLRMLPGKKTESICCQVLASGSRSMFMNLEMSPVQR